MSCHELRSPKSHSGLCNKQTGAQNQCLGLCTGKHNGVSRTPEVLVIVNENKSKNFMVLSQVERDLVANTHYIPFVNNL